MGVAVRVEWMTLEKNTVPLSPVANYISLWPPGNSGVQLPTAQETRLPQSPQD